MTARRLAASAALIRSAHGIPAELLDPKAAIWHNRTAFLAYMKAAGWSLPPQDRLGGPVEASPKRRRTAALEGWAVESGQAANEAGTSADYHKLAALRLLPVDVPDD